MAPWCSILSGIVIPGSVTSIRGYTFSGCSKLTSATIPNSVTNIGERAFFGCSILTGVTISDSIISIGDSAFSGCSKLTDIFIPRSVASIGLGAFSNCLKLTAITVDGANLSYCSLDGVLFSKGMGTLIQCPGGKEGRYTIPAGVTIIGEAAFYNCAGLISVTIPGSVTSIGDAAFYFCTGLTGIFFKGDVPTLGTQVFSSPSNATVYYLPETLGWATFDEHERQPLLWNPVIQNDELFGVKSDRFGFNITGTANIPFIVEACTNLAENLWVPLHQQPITLLNGSYYFSDSNWDNYPARYYRINTP